MVPYVSDFYYPILSQITLDRKVPGLGCGHDVMPRYCQNEQKLRRERPRAARRAAIVRELSGVAASEALQ